MNQASAASGSHLLEIRNLNVEYEGVPIVKDVSLDLSSGEILGVVGESGCGKSTLFHAILQLLGKDGRPAGGTICFEGQNLGELKERQLRRLRGARLGAIFQNPGDSLNPSRRIKTQFFEALRAHRKITRKQSQALAVDMMTRLHLDNGAELLERYPFQLSGGMNQRVALALAMVMNPALLLADEPTSALDVTVQAQVVREMMEMRDAFGTAILIITHNMGVVSYMADRVAVMYAGRIVEYGKKEQVLAAPAHPYTQALLQAIPDFSAAHPKGLPGSPPPFGRKSSGCEFADRCHWAHSQCREGIPLLRQVGSDHFSSCIRQHQKGARL